MNKYKYFRFAFIILFFNIFFPFENNNLDLINFNIRGFGKIVSGCDVKKKINLILENVSNYDIMLFQENWKYNDLFKDKLENHQLLISTYKKNIFSQSSGLLIAINKNIDIISNTHILYNDCNGIISNGYDCFASKGFLLSRIKYLNRIIDIYNTHLDAGNSKKDHKIRQKQLNELKEYIINNSLNNNVIICGDFNIDYSTSNEIKEFQNDLDLDVVNWNSSYFLEKKIDYIFYRIKFSHEISNEGIPDILYTLSDHPPISFSINTK